MALAPATRTKTDFSSSPGANAASTLPSTVPATTGAAHSFNTSMRVAPLARWVRNDWIDVGTMIASELPTHRCMRTASGTASVVKTW